MRLLKTILVWFAVSVLCGCASLPDTYVALEDSSTLGLNETLRRIENERVIFIGEAHTSGSDHLVQLAVIRHLHENGRKAAVALEVFPAWRQAVLDAWIGGRLSQYDFEMECNSIWNMLFWYYGDIFLYARDNRIPLLGVNAEKSHLNSVAKNGPAAVSREELEKIGFISCGEDPVYEQVMRTAGERFVHEAELPYLCDAQRLGDAVMAYNIADFLRRNDLTMVVLLGAAHASKIGVPKMLRNHLDAGSTVLLPDSFGSLTGREVGADLADYIWY